MFISDKYSLYRVQTNIHCTVSRQIFSVPCLWEGKASTLLPLAVTNMGDPGSRISLVQKLIELEPNEVIVISWSINSQALREIYGPVQWLHKYFKIKIQRRFVSCPTAFIVNRACVSVCWHFIVQCVSGDDFAISIFARCWSQLSPRQVSSSLW